MNKKFILIIILSTRMFGYMQILSHEEQQRLVESPDRLFDLLGKKGLFDGQKIKPTRSVQYHLEKLFGSPDEIAAGLKSADIRTSYRLCPTNGADVELTAPLITIAALCSKVEWVEKILAGSENKKPLADSVQFSPLVAALNGFNFKAVMEFLARGYKKPEAASNKINTWDMPYDVFIKALEAGFEPEYFNLRCKTDRFGAPVLKEGALVFKEDDVKYNSEIIKRYPEKVMLPPDFSISRMDEFPNQEIFELSRFKPVLEYKRALNSSDMKALYQADLRIRTSNTGINLLPFVDIFMDYLKLENVHEISESVAYFEDVAPSVNNELLKKLDNCEEEFIVRALEAFVPYQNKKEYQLPIISLLCRKELPEKDLELQFSSLMPLVHEIRNKIEAGDWQGIKNILKEDDLQILLCGLFISRYKKSKREVYHEKLEKLKPYISESLFRAFVNLEETLEHKDKPQQSSSISGPSVSSNEGASHQMDVCLD